MENIYNAIQNVYNMDKTTWQEVLAELYNLVSKVENKFDTFENKFGSLLGEEVTRELKKMYDNGSLSSLINNKVLKDIKTEFSEQLKHKANLDTVFTMGNMGQDIKEAMTGGSVAVVGKNSVNYQNLQNDLKSLIQTDNSIKTFNLNTVDDFNLINCNPITITDNNIYMSGIIKGYFGGIVLKDIVYDEYSYILPESNNNRTVWHIYRIEDGYIYVLHFYNTTTVTNMKLGTGTTNDVKTLGTFTHSSNLVPGETLTIKINGSTHEFYHKNTKSFELSDCNAIGIADGIQSKSPTIRAKNFGGYSYYNTLSIPSNKIIYNGKTLDEILRSKTKNSYLNNKKVIFMGDSLTNNQGTYTSKAYFKWLEEWYNLTIFVDGQNGSSIRDNTSDSARAMCNRFVNLPDDYDIVIVFGGTNDWNANSLDALGTFGDSDIHTFYGAMKTLCEGLIKKYPNKLIVFMLPFKHFKGGSRPVNNAMIEVLQDNGIPYIDFYAVGGINPNIEEHKNLYMLKDNIHFNETGHKLIAERLDGFLNSLKIN